MQFLAGESLSSLSDYPYVKACLSFTEDFDQSPQSTPPKLTNYYVLYSISLFDEKTYQSCIEKELLKF